MNGLNPPALHTSQTRILMMNLSRLTPRKTGATPVSILFAALCLFDFRGTAAIPSPERLLPDDTLIVVTAPDFNKLREINQDSPQARLWNDPGMKSFRDKFTSKLNEELIGPLERDLGVRFDDYARLLQGQVTLALVQNGWGGADDQQPGILLLLDAKARSSQLKTNLAELQKKWLSAGKSIKTEKIRGVDFSVIPLSSNDVPKTLQKFLPASGAGAARANGDDAPKDAPRNELVVGQFESLLIVGNSTRVVEKVVVHLTGGSMPALADLAAYQANRLAVFRDAPLYGWVNARAFLDVINRTPSSKEPDAADPFPVFSPQRILKATGLNGLKTLAFGMQNSPDGSLLQVFLGMPESGRQGLFKILPGSGKEAGPPPFVPADVVKFQRSRIDGQKTWAALQAMMNDISPQMLGGLNFMLDSANTAAREKDPNFDIKKNLFGNLGDDLISYQKAPRGGTLADLNASPALVLIGSPQPEQLAAALKSILVLVSQQGGAPAEREFLGRKIYSVPLPGQPPAAANSPAAPRSLSYAASSGYVALTTDDSILEAYLRSSEGQQKALRDMPGLAEATAKVGGTSSGWFGYENQVETSRFLLEALRRSSAAGTNATNKPAWAGPALFPGADTVKDWLDFSLLPAFDSIAKYFYFTVYTVGTNPDGFTFKMFAPVPPQLK